MKRILLLLCLMGLACTDQKKPKIVHNTDGSKTMDVAIKDTTSIRMMDFPIHIDSTNYLLHPVGDFVLKDGRNKVLFSSRWYEQANYNVARTDGTYIAGNLSNILFQTLDSNGIVPLTKKDMNIQYLTFLRDIYKQLNKSYLLYEINDRDTNQDGSIDNNDVSALYLSKLDGSNFTKLTAEGHELLDWKLVSTANRLYYKTIEDTDRDGDFDKKDRFHYYFINFYDPQLKSFPYQPL